MNRRKIRTVSVVACLSLCMCALAGCVQIVDSALGNVDPAGFERGSSCEVEYLNSDTVSVRDISVLVRAEALARYTPFDIQIKCFAPDSTVYIGNLTLGFNDRVRLRGGSYAEYRQLFCRNAVLGKEGVYRFVFSHSLAEPVKGIWNMGIDIQPTEHGKR